MSRHLSTAALCLSLGAMVIVGWSTWGVQAEVPATPTPTPTNFALCDDALAKRARAGVLMRDENRDPDILEQAIRLRREALEAVRVYCP